MKLWCATGVAVAVGIVAGLAIGWARIAYMPWDGSLGGENRPAQAPSADVSPGTLHPKVVVSEETYDFGSMDSETTREHEFVFTNTGDAPLKLTKGDSTCKCTVSNVDGTEIPPGGSAKVRIQWTAKNMSGPFRQNATIHTNDPAKPRVTLSLVGRITSKARAEPSELVFTRLSPGEEVEGKVRLYGYLADQTLEVTRFDLSDKTLADRFEVSHRPLTADEVKEETDAKSGVHVRILIKPGLPLGKFEQRITFQTNLKDFEKIEVPVRGAVVSDISVAAKEWNDELGVLMLGTISSREGAERTFNIMVRGPHSRQVKFETEEVYPPQLRVKIGETVELGGGAMTKTPVIIQIPKGSHPADHSGSEQARLGRILLKTNHPQSPQLRVYVRFAIEG